MAQRYICARREQVLTKVDPLCAHENHVAKFGYLLAPNGEKGLYPDSLNLKKRGVWFVRLTGASPFATTTKGLMGGYGVGYGLMMNVGSVIPDYFTFHSLVVALLVTRWLPSALVVWAVRILMPYILAQFGGPALWLEMIHYFIFCGWGIFIFVKQFPTLFAVSSQYPLLNAVWNDTTTVYQGNETYTSVDQSTTVLSFASLNLTLALIYFILASMALGRVSMRIRGINVAERKAKKAEEDFQKNGAMFRNHDEMRAALGEEAYLDYLRKTNERSTTSTQIPHTTLAKQRILKKAVYQPPTSSTA